MNKWKCVSRHRIATVIDSCDMSWNDWHQRRRYDDAFEKQNVECDGYCLHCDEKLITFRPPSSHHHRAVNIVIHNNNNNHNNDSYFPKNGRLLTSSSEHFSN